MIPSLRQLQYLTLLAEHGSFSRAAEAAHVSQPALSAGVQELEKILGAAVVERTRGNVILTAVGEEAVRRAGVILAQVEDLVEAAHAAGKPLSGRFRLGVIPTIAPFLLPRALPALKARFPQLRLFLREDQTSRLIAGLRAGTLDAALIALPYDTSGLDVAPVARDALRATFPSDHPGGAASPVDLSSLNRDELILLEDGHCLRDHALAACGLSAPGEDRTFAATSLHTLVQMVGAGLGVTLLPDMAVQAGLAETARVTVRPLMNEQAMRDIVLVWRYASARTPEARLLATSLKEICEAAPVA